MRPLPPAVRLGPLARAAVRLRVRDRLRAELGAKARRLTRAKVAGLLAVATDEVIDDATDLSGPPPVRGPVPDWLAAHPDFIARVADLILGLLV